MKQETQCLHTGYSPKNGEPRVLPIVQSTTFKYTTTENVAKLFDLQESGFFYTRLGNPTVDRVEKKIAALEGGIGALCTSSGQAATTIACLNLMKAGDHMIASSSIYGGTFNLFGTTFKRFGIDVTFIDQHASDEEISKAFRPNTKLVFGETLTNPSMDVFDIERFANLAHAHGVPLIIDNTFATPVLCKPFDFGADIVVHSTTKYLDGHAVQMGGVIVDSGAFDWKSSGRFPEFCEPDPSYHGLVYTESFGKAAYIVKARVQLMRDLGCCQSPQGAFYINLGLETLAIRMERYAKNAEIVATFLASHPQVESIKYPTLPGSPDRALATKYLPKGACGVISFVLKGGRSAGARFIDSLQLISLEVHVADIRSCVLHPASSTHRQLTDSQLAECGIEPGSIRLSVGLEHTDDILADLSQALQAL
ncbi:MAG: O-acetylhomoserine aminocarboxypropyltransferase/cysteine synthase [Desulfovibrio sp.]|nr:O-acetylhomoserine aminocarboxypropyltransferase/cysteine synthase [Desulfovibrio sp.]